jgi:hypothetical protein
MARTPSSPGVATLHRRRLANASAIRGGAFPAEPLDDVRSRWRRTTGVNGAKNGRQRRGAAPARYSRRDDFRRDRLILGVELVDEALHLRAVERARA